MTVLTAVMLFWLMARSSEQLTLYHERKGSVKIIYKVISITQFGKAVNLDRYTINFVGKDFILATPKGSGSCFVTRFDSSNCYNVITEKVG